MRYFGQGFSRRGGFQVGLLLVAIIGLFFAPVVAGSAGAQASLLPGICGDAGDAPGVRISSGWSPPIGALESEEFIGTAEYGATAYEWWGGQIFDFTTSTSIDENYAHVDARENCGLLNAVTGIGQSGFAGSIWTMFSTVNTAAMWVYQTAQSQEMFIFITNTIIDPIVQGTYDADSNPDGSRGLGSYFFSIATLVLVLTALYAGIRILRGRVKEAMGGLIWQVVFLTVGALLVLNPTLLPKGVAAVASTGQAAVNEVATGVASSLGAGESTTRDYCNLDVDYAAGDGKLPVPTREATCRLWSLTYLGPWSQGQFGTTLPVATDALNADGTPAPDRWTAKKNKELAIALPGLESQPQAGSLIPLQLSALYLNPLEQRWIDRKIKAEGLRGAAAATRELELIQQLKGPRVGQEDAAVAYPAGEVGNFCPSGGFCIVNQGHETVWTVLRDRATESQQPGVALTWTGTSAEGASARWNSTVQMTLGSLMVVSTAGFFGLASIWYQFLLGLMLAFMGIALLAMLVPGYGVQVARDFFAKLLRNVIMWILATGFMTITAVLVIYVPDMILPDVSTSNIVGAATGGAQILMRFLIGLLVGVAMLVVWFRVRKAMSTQSIIKGANTDSAWDVGGKISGGVGKGVKAAGAVAVVAGAAVASAGASAAVTSIMAGRNAVAGGSDGADPNAAGADPNVAGGAAGAAAIGSAAGATVSSGPMRGGVVLGGSQPAAGAAQPAAGAAVAAATGASMPGASAATSQAQQTGTSVARTFASTFRSELARSIKGVGSSMLSAIMSGQGLSAISHQARNAVTEAVTGVQTRAVVRDSQGRETILESGADARGPAAPPPSPQTVMLVDNMQQLVNAAAPPAYVAAPTADEIAERLAAAGFAVSGRPSGGGSVVLPSSASGEASSGSGGESANQAPPPRRRSYLDDKF